jgi:hypothetical protein
MADVIEGLRKEHGLLAAYLEAADKIDCRLPSRRVATAKAFVAPVSPQVAPLVPTPSPLVFQRANLVRV